MTCTLINKNEVKSILASFLYKFREHEILGEIKSTDDEKQSPYFNYPTPTSSLISPSKELPRRDSQDAKESTSSEIHTSVLTSKSSEAPPTPVLSSITTELGSITSILQALKLGEQYQATILDEVRHVTNVEKNDEAAKRFLEHAAKEPLARKKMRFLNRSLAAAESSAVCAEVYANRAELLLKIKEQELALLDVNRALKLKGFSMDTQIKTKLTMVKLNANNELLARKDYRRMAIEYPFEEGKERTAFERALEFSRKIRAPDEDQEDATVYEDSPHEIWNIFGKSPWWPLTDKVKLTYTPKNGWHWLAKEDIEAGEVLSTTDYYGLRLSEENLGFYCSYCTSWFLAPIACKDCQMEMYCSEHCRAEAYNSYHETEHKLFPHLSYLKDPELTLLALRMFLIGTEQGARLRGTPPHDLKTDFRVYKGLFMRRDLSEDEMVPNEYRTVLSLMWNKKEETDFDKLLIPVLHHDVIEVFLALRKINFFSEESDPTTADFEEEEIVALIFLIQNAGLLLFNRTEVKAPFFLKENGRQSFRNIGYGLNTLHSLLNHSCNPSAATIRDRRRELLFAIRPIAAGEQIFISYAGTYGLHTYKERHECLAPYKIDRCRCEACVNGWLPWTEDEMWKQPERYIYEQKKKEFTKNEKNRKRKQYRRDKQLIDELKKNFDLLFEDPSKVTEENLEELFNNRSFLHKCVIHPSFSLWMCEDLIKAFMPILRGNFRTLSEVETNPSPPS